MASLKLKFKIETLYKINKFSQLDEINALYKNSDSRLKYKPSSAKHSVRNSKILTNDYETLPGYEQETANLDPDDKEELLSYMKNLDYNTLHSIFTSIQNKQLYSKMKTKIGLEIIKSTYKEIIKSKLENCFMEEENNLQHQEFLTISDECELYYYFKDILNITEIEAIEIFELFKYNELFSFNEINFVVLVYILASYECANLEDFTKIFIDDLYNFISGNEAIVNLARLKDVARMLGINEKILSGITKELGMDMYTSIDQNKFKEFYTQLAKKHDSQIKNQSIKGQGVMNSAGQGIASAGGVGYGMKKNQKTGGTGCMSKACNIL
jgi:hypothetical protein